MRSALFYVSFGSCVSAFDIRWPTLHVGRRLAAGAECRVQNGANASEERVELRGLEPLSSTLPALRSPSRATAPLPAGGARQPRVAGAARIPHGAASALRLSVRSPTAAGATRGSSKGHARDSRYAPARSHPPAQTRINGKRSRVRLPTPS